MKIRRLTVAQRRMVADALRRAASETRRTAVEASTPTSVLGINDNHVQALLALGHEQDQLAVEIERVTSIVLEKT